MEEFSTSLNHLPLLRSSHWSNHNFVFHKSPKPLVLTKYKDSHVKLQLEEMIGQVEDKHLATAVCGGPAGVVGSAQCAQEDQTGGDDGQHPDTR